jgi:hypothetical protein
MFGPIRRATGVASDALDSVSPYVDRLANDEKLRQRLVAAIGAGVAARKTARNRLGWSG